MNRQPIATHSHFGRVGIADSGVWRIGIRPVGIIAGGSIGQIHWESPIVVNGHVYMTDEDGNLYSYEL